MDEDLLADLLKAVEQQLSSTDTPYVRKAFDRMVELGVEVMEAKTQIALCLGDQMDTILRSKRPFDEKAYQASLDQLPMAEEQDSD